ncbi:MAG: glycosyltransferase N-terminal domain-containing protein [Maribacter sp.]
MAIIYNLLVHIAWFSLRLLAKLSPKLKLFVEGRKQTFAILEKSISQDDKIIWMHAASLGEFEQGLPIIEKSKSEFPDFKILVTFFSPSGYEIKKNTSAADVVVYLPMDTKANAKRFLETVRPALVLFVKYEIWPNYLKEIESRNIPTLLLSAIFRKEQLYFKWYGGLMRNALAAFSHIFVQNKESQELLASINMNNSAVSGDTRLDRVTKILERDNNLPLVRAFKEDALCLVAGSTWPDDEAHLVHFINTSSKSLKFILAPHKIEKAQIIALSASINKNTVLFSEADLDTIGTFEVLIIDNIGMLTKVYSYADIAYVGGAFSTGLHNTLEPAVFGIPVIIGPNYQGFKEAEDLVGLKGILSVQNKKELSTLLNALVEQPELLQKTGAINATYIAKNKGASIQIMEHIRTLL